MILLDTIRQKLLSGAKIILPRDLEEKFGITSARQDISPTESITQPEKPKIQPEKPKIEGIKIPPLQEIFQKIPKPPEFVAERPTPTRPIIDEEEKVKAERLKETLKEIARTFPREGAGAVMEVIERVKRIPPGSLTITPGAGEVLPREKYGKLGPKVEKFLFGEKPVESLSKQGENILRGIGVPESPAKQFGLTAGMVVLGLDLLPPGGKDIIKLLAKSTKSEDVLKILQTLKGIDKTKITDDMVETIAKTTDEKQIAKLVEGLRVSEIPPAKVEAPTTEIAKITPKIPNLARIKAPEDIKSIITETSQKYVGKIEEARRGVITHIQTQEMADGLGMTAEKLIKRRAGKAFNAEELTAAREIMVSSANEVSRAAKAVRDVGSDESLFNFIQAFKRHAAIQQEVMGATAEAGRALSALRIAVEPGQLKTEFYKKVIDALGGREMTEEIAKKMAMIDPLDFIAMNRFIRGITKSTTPQKVFEYWINAILSNPTTHIVNTVSNFLVRLSKIPLRVGETSLDFLRSSFTGTPRERYLGEVAADIVGMTKGLKEGVKRAVFAWKEELPMEAITKLEVARRQAIPGKVGEFIRIPGRALIAEDEFFKAVNSQAELYAQAYRQAVKEGLKGQSRAKRMADLISDPTPEMLDAVRAEELYRTFQKELGRAGGAVMRLRDNIPGLNYIIPFIRTPVNIAKFGLEMTPLNFLRLGYMRARGMIKGVKFTDELAKPVMGSLISAATALYAAQGKITGHAPTDKEERDAFYREGKQPYSVRIGDTWYSYQRMEPLGTIVGMIADFVQDFKLMGEDDKTKAIRSITSSITQNLINKTYMQGLSSMMNAIDDPVRYGGDWVEGLASGFVPQIALTPTRAIDPYFRRPAGVVDAWKKKIPGLSRDVPPVRNVFGEKQKLEGGILARMISPFRIGKAKEDPVDIELKNLGIEIGFPSKTLGSFNLDERHYDIYLRATGRRIKRILDDLVKDSEYQKLSDAEKEKIITSVVTDVRTKFKDEMLFVLFVSQMDIDIPETISQEKAAQIFYELLKEPKFKEASNNKKREFYVRNLEKYMLR